MLERTVTQRIEMALERGDWSAIVDALEQFPDLRWGDLPPLSRKALAAFAAKLPTEQQLQESLTASLFHPNRTIRLFVRKILQNLKYPAYLAPFIRNKLDDYLRKTPALPFSFKPDEAAQRRAQVETVKNAVALLLQCDADEFLGYYAAILTELLRIQEEQNRRWKQLSKIQRQLQKRESQIFKERFGHLGLEQYELPRRLQRELQEALLNDPEYQRLIEELQRQRPERLTLLEESGTVREAFGDALDDLFDPKRKGKDEKVEKVRAKLWEWVEGALRQGEKVGIALLTVHHWQLSNWLGEQKLVERSLSLLAQTKSHAHREAWKGLLWAFARALEATEVTTLPETLTPEVMRALKIGDEQVDGTIERLAQRLEERLGKAKREWTVWWWEEEQRAIAEKFTTLQERLSALLNPPIVKQEWVISRETLLEFWRQSEGWDEQVDELREKAVPLLWEQLREIVAAWHALRSRKALAELAGELGEPAKQILTERELKLVLRGRKQQVEEALKWEANDIFVALLTLDPTNAWFSLLDEVERSSFKEWLEVMYFCPLPSDLDLLVALLERFERWKEERLSAHMAEKLIRVIAEQCYGKWLESMPQFSEGHDLLEVPPPTELPKPDPQSLRLMRRAYKVLEQTDEAKYVQGEYAAVLYCWGTPEAMREVKEILQKGRLSINDLAKLALLRRDYDLIAPLAKQLGYWLNPSVSALWEELVNKAPEKLPKVVAELLAFIAEATDVWQVRATLEMLQRVADRHDLFAPHFNLLMNALDSTIPEVVQFAMEQLEKLVKASPKRLARQWFSIGERVREKLWSDKITTAKGAARLLSLIGEHVDDAAPVVVEALSEALYVNSLPLLELVLRGLVKIKASHTITFNEGIKKRLAELSEQHPERLGSLCRKLLS